MKQNANHQQQNQPFYLSNQQKIATSTLRELTHEEEFSLNGKKPSITYRCRYNYNSHINSWRAQQISLIPKETTKSKNVLQKIRHINKERKLKRKIYKNPSTTLLQLSQSIQIITEKSKMNQKAAYKSRNRITTSSSFTQRNKILATRFKKQRIYLSNPFSSNQSFEDSVKITQLSKMKNKESSAIKKLKCELIQKTQQKNEQKNLNLRNLNTQKVRFSLQPRLQCLKSSNRYVTFEAENEVIIQQKQNIKKRMIRTLSNSVRQHKSEVKYSNFFSVDRRKQDKGLIYSQQFKVLINLLNKQKGSQNT